MSASISSLPCIVAMRAAKLAPVRPARTIAVSIGRQLAHRCDADEVRDVDAGAERLELHGADKSEDGAHQDIDDAYDEQCATARLRQHLEHLAAANLGAPGDESRQQKHDLPEQVHECVQVARAIHGEQTNPRDKTRLHGRACPSGRFRTRQREQLVQVLWQPVNGDLRCGLSSCCTTLARKAASAVPQRHSAGVSTRSARTPPPAKPQLFKRSRKP